MAKELLSFLSSRLLTLRASAAATAVAGATGTVVSGIGHYRRWIILLNITASAHENGDTLDVYIDVSLDGTTWINAVRFATQAGDGAAKKEFAILDPAAPGAVIITATSDCASGVTRPAAWGDYMRARWTVTEAGADADASHTFSVIALGQP